MEAEPAEAEARAAWQRGDHDRATQLALTRYGAEILAFLSARLRNHGDADDVFGSFAEKLWHGMPGFRWRSSLRSWCYLIARNAANDYVTAAHRRRERNLTLDKHAALSQLVERLRTETAAYRRTEVKDRMQELRESLPADDQMILILRIDRELSWRELAVALADGEAPTEDAEISREAAKLRKRFERIKGKLRELAEQEGLL